ncbi:MAG TPA: nucleotidyltransferase family protein, partial [Candidatus Nitrosotalea sp.]|nr:nucleotidyltransferase family protein [Candidatus Nitrosotalea sp.]
MVFFISNLELTLRGRTYIEPASEHAALASGADLDLALDHLARRADCRALGVIGALADQPPEASRLAALAGRRVLLADSDRGRVLDYAAQVRLAGAEVEWLVSSNPTPEEVSAWALPVVAVILAAGAGTRMGSNKLLLDLGGEPLVTHVVRAALEGGCDHALVVHSDPEVAAAVRSRALTVHNPDAASGQASSLRAGLKAAPADAAGALIMLGDQPLVGERSVRVLLQAWRREGAPPALAATYGGPERWLPPVLVERELWPDLIELSGDAGARQLFQRRPELLGTIPVGGGAQDVDTPADYRRLLRIFSKEGG